MTRATARLTVLVATGVLGATLVAAPATAAPTWRPATDLFADLSAPGGSAFTPAIGVDAAGDATVVWSRWDGTQYVVQAAQRPAGGTWTAPVDLGTSRQPNVPQVVVDGAGNATAMWRRFEADRTVVQSARRPDDGAWTAAVDVATDPSADYTRRDVPQLAVDGAGTVTATWSRFEAATGQPWKDTVQSATRPVDGAWSAPVDLSAPGTAARTSDVAVDAAGNATAVWAAGASLQAATRPAGGAWTAPVQVSGTAGPRANPRVVVDPTGAATAVWGSFAGAAYGVQTASHPLGGAWSTPLDLGAGEVFDTPALAVDRQGVATAVWQQQAYGGEEGWVVTSARRAPGGAWSAPVALSASGDDSWDPQVAVAPSGAATAVWAHDTTGGRVVEAARLEAGAGAEWSEPVALSEPGESSNPQVAVDPAGNATAAWSRKEGGSWIVQARGLDAAGPVVTALTGTGGPGASSRTFSVAAYDVWSDVTSARWRFADGTTATGTSVSHTDAGGAQGPVRVTLTDTVGNTTVCTYTQAYSCRSARVAPVIDRARLSARTIRAVGSDARTARRTKATVLLSADARVTFTFRRVGGGARPVRLVERLDAGRNVVGIRARLGARKVLTPGRWKVSVVAANTVGASRPQVLALRVVR